MEFTESNGAPSSEKLAEKRGDYYDKWEKFANEQEKEAEEEDKKAEAEAKTALGLDKDEPKSEAEKKDREKRAALKAAKKLWDDKKLSEQASKVVLDHQDTEMVVNDEILGGKGVIFFKGSKKSTFKIPADLTMKLVKVFIEDCEDCTFEIEASTISQHIEVSHSNSCKVHFRAITHIVQVDLCKDLEIRYAEAVFDRDQHKIIHAGVSTSNVHVHGSQGMIETVHIDYIKDGAKEHLQKTKEEHQFVTHFQDGKLVTEEVFRSKGNMPLTKKQIEEAEKLGDGDGLQTIERMAELKKIGGNEAFAEGEYAQAAIYYTEALDMADPESKLVPVCFANRAASYLKIGHLQEALEDSEQAIKYDPNYVKGWFRKGLSLHAMKRYREAAQTLSKALDMEPKNQQIKQALGFAELNLRKSMQQ